MSHDTEVHLAIKGTRNIVELTNSLGLEILGNYNRKVSDKDFIADPSCYCGLGGTYNGIDKKIIKAWKNSIKRKGWKALLHEDERFFVINTEFGNREAKPWSLYICYDPWEVGDWPEDATISINLSSRYFPCFIDMKNDCGGLYSLDLTEIMSNVIIAQEEIVKVVPEFSILKPILRDKFY